MDKWYERPIKKALSIFHAIKQMPGINTVNTEDSVTIFTKSVPSKAENEPILHMGHTELNT